MGMQALRLNIVKPFHQRGYLKSNLPLSSSISGAFGNCATFAADDAEEDRFWPFSQALSLSQQLCVHDSLQALDHRAIESLWAVSPICEHLVFWLCQLCRCCRSRSRQLHLGLPWCHWWACFLWHFAKMAYEDLKRWRDDCRVNNQTCKVSETSEESTFKTVRWSDVQVGSFLKLQRDQPVPADLLPLGIGSDI